MNRLLGHMQRFKHAYPSVEKLINENEQKIIHKKKQIGKIKLKKYYANIKNFSFDKSKNYLLKCKYKYKKKFPGRNNWRKWQWKKYDN